MKRTPLKRAPLRPRRLKPRNARVVVSADGWRLLRERKLGPCRICGRLPASLHHLVSRSLLGDDVEENLVPLCGDGTRGCHGDVEAHRPAALSLLRAALRPEELAYMERKMGRGFADRRYPTEILERRPPSDRGAA